MIKRKKRFCIFMSTVLVVMAFSAATFSPVASAESGQQPPALPEGAMPGDPPAGMGGPGGEMGMPPEGGRPDGAPGGMGGPGSSADIEYSGAVEIVSAENQEDQSYESSTADQSALLISTTEDVSIANPTVTKKPSLA